MTVKSNAQREAYIDIAANGVWELERIAALHKSAINRLRQMHFRIAILINEYHVALPDVPAKPVSLNLVITSAKLATKTLNKIRGLVNNQTFYSLKVCRPNSDVEDVFTRLSEVRAELNYFIASTGQSWA